ncbi:hypothetical protein BEL04_00410 [Mucilaginibacter sp. PPCGB 2223]|nr:hypothetical protein BEL04_00410 [Mucilaginibacter sp. PPCGB 2223]
MGIRWVFMGVPMGLYPTPVSMNKTTRRYLLTYKDTHFKAFLIGFYKKYLLLQLLRVQQHAGYLLI